MRKNTLNVAYRGRRACGHGTRQIMLAILVIAFAVSCSPISKKALTRKFEATEQRFQDQTGFMLFDLAKDKTVFEYNSDKYFTPASNTKIFTFFASLSLIGDSIPALKYVERGDSIIIWGTGDPSLLYKNTFNTGKTFEFLSSRSWPLYFSSLNYQTTHFGSGWAWDDYNDNYSAERSALPVYGNLLFVDATPSGVSVKPSYYQKFVYYKDDSNGEVIVRNPESNLIRIKSPLIRTVHKEVPAKVDDDVVVQLLSDTLGKQIQRTNAVLPKDARTLFSIPSDSLYKVMMQESDNFIAEQLLLVCAGILSDTLKPEIVISYMKNHQLKDLRDAPVWVDGSGLSRYNLFTPRSIVQLWQKIYAIVPRERLFSLLAIGGKAGTIRNWYKADKPFIFGKTGSLSNNHCLSGYLLTRSGKTLIFSFMNSNFAASTSDIRRNMQSILNEIYEKY